MSDLEDAAAAHARRLRREAEAAAAQRAEAQRAAEQELARLRARAREFFAFARDHGAPVFRRYDPAEPMANTKLTRTDEVCVVVVSIKYEVGGPKAVTSSGLVYPWARLHQKRRFLNPWFQGIRDNVFVTADIHSRSYGAPGNLIDWVAAAAALLDPVAGAGVQKDGSIKYL
ncbi:hypothetical protein ACIRU3_26920 [Streptomyces sp. NPDC101151]|uniref:hypothetical protein n=1 Tax=Streptomyces sp. NPDC101151 TaxID=3366115 RepID=UPI003812284B